MFNNPFAPKTTTTSAPAVKVGKFQVGTKTTTTTTSGFGKNRRVETTTTTKVGPFTLPHRSATTATRSTKAGVSFKFGK